LVLLVHTVAFRFGPTSLRSIQQKTRDWLAIAGFFEIFRLLPVIRIRDAKSTGTTLPHGDVAANARWLVHVDERGVHFLSRIGNTIGPLLSKAFHPKVR
jgi:hypothetical protein